jgi:phage-related protein
MNLSQRLQSELIGEDVKGRCGYYTCKMGEKCGKVHNALRTEQRKRLPETVATIAADLKGMLPEREEHKPTCPWHKRNTHCFCGAIAYNNAIEESEAAVDRYCGLTGEENTKHE